MRASRVAALVHVFSSVQLGVLCELVCLSTLALPCGCCLNKPLELPNSVTERIAGALRCAPEQKSELCWLSRSQDECLLSE